MVEQFCLAGHDFRHVGAGSDWSGTTITVATQPDTHMPVMPLDFHLFELCLDGHHSGLYEIENLAFAKEADCAYRPGALFLYASGAAGQIALDGHSKNLHIMIEREVMDEAKAEVYRGDPAEVEVLSFNQRHNPRMKQIAQALHLEMLMPSAGGALKADALTFALCLAVLEEAPNGEKRTSRHDVRLSETELARCFVALEQEISEGGGLKVVATNAGLSPSRLSHGFAAATGQSPHQYVIERRMTRARERLETTDDTLVDIAFDCGFSSQSHMTDVFRQKLGVTPRRYRTEAR